MGRGAPVETTFVEQGVINQTTRLFSAILPNNILEISEHFVV